MEMGFWQWAGAFILAVVSGSLGLKLIGWLKEHLDRKARKISYHAKALLEQADQICGIARALLAAAKSPTDDARYLAQASILWNASSASSLLNVWQANAWVLDRPRRLRERRAGFERAVKQLRQVAVEWKAAHEKLMPARSAPLPQGQGHARFPGEQKSSVGSTLLTGFASCPRWPSQDDFDRVLAPVTEAFEAFLREFQALHNALQPLVREYVSRIEVPTGEGKR